MWDHAMLSKTGLALVGPIRPLGVNSPSFSYSVSLTNLTYIY
jgi:hypothetical protein